MNHNRQRSVAAACILAVFVAASTAAADEPPSAADQALATTLFREAKALLEIGKVPEACAKLAESQRLDPGGGTLLNLAVCHEREGKTATAWAELFQARIVAEHDHRSDRAELADAHMKALEPKLSKITILVSRDVDIPEMELLLDQRVVRRPAWGTGVPVDPGDHTIEARAPSKKVWHTDVHVLPNADTKTVSIPAWEDEPPPPVAIKIADAEPAIPPPPPNRTPAIVVLGASMSAIAIGSILGAYALRKHGDPAVACSTTPCSADSLSANDAAKTAADASSVAFALGAVGLGVGAYLWFSGNAASNKAHAVHVTPFGLSGTF